LPIFSFSHWFICPFPPSTTEPLLPTFGYSSRAPQPLKMKALHSFESLGSVNHATQSNNEEDQNSQSEIYSQSACQ
jgi:hypothetical protein